MTYAWYSAEFDRFHGHAVYLREDGARVKVTEARDWIKEPTTAFAWLDLEYVGVVGRQVGLVQRGQRERFV